MLAAWQLIAQVQPPAPQWDWKDPRFIWATLALLAVILTGAIVLAWLDRWRRRPASLCTTANDQLAQFRQLYEKGELSQAEFDNIRAKLSTQLRKELDIPARPAAAAHLPGPRPPESGMNQPNT
jgi:hypothetical protein